jgi:hypothetical protein
MPSPHAVCCRQPPSQPHIPADIVLTLSPTRRVLPTRSLLSATTVAATLTRKRRTRQMRLSMRTQTSFPRICSRSIFSMPSATCVTPPPLFIPPPLLTPPLSSMSIPLLTPPPFVMSNPFLTPAPLRHRVCSYTHQRPRAIHTKSDTSLYRAVFSEL